MRVLLVLLLLVVALVSAADRRIDKSHLTVAVWNAEFLFDGKAPEGRARFPWKNKPRKAREHMEAVAGVIRSLDADILALMEVENLEILETLNRELLAGRGYAAYLVEGKDSYTGQDCGLLSRIDPDTFTRINAKLRDSQGKDRGVSKNFLAHFTVNGEPLLLAAAHFISLRGDNSAYREAQARILAEALRKKAGKAAIILLGDFNDFDPDCPDIAGHPPNSYALRILKDFNPSQKGPELFSTAEKLPGIRRYTCWHNRDDDDEVDTLKELSMLDHLLLSRTLFGKIAETGIRHERGDKTSVSDHYPVWVRLKL